MILLLKFVVIITPQKKNYFQFVKIYFEVLELK
jgi:hypothetical protein